MKLNDHFSPTGLKILGWIGIGLYAVLGALTIIFEAVVGFVFCTGVAGPYLPPTTLWHMSLPAGLSVAGLAFMLLVILNRFFAWSTHQLNDLWAMLLPGGDDMMILPTNDDQLTATFPQFTTYDHCLTYVRELFADHAYAMLVPRDQHHNELAAFVILLGCLSALPNDCAFGDRLVRLGVIPHYYQNEPQWDLLVEVNHHGRNQSFMINYQELADALWQAQTEGDHHI